MTTDRDRVEAWTAYCEADPEAGEVERRAFCTGWQAAADAIAPPPVPEEVLNKLARAAQRLGARGAEEELEGVFWQILSVSAPPADTGDADPNGCQMATFEGLLQAREQLRSELKEEIANRVALTRRNRELEEALRELHRTVNASVLARAADGLLEALLRARAVLGGDR